MAHTHTREKLWSWLYPARSSRVLVWLTASRRHCQRPRESPQAVFPDRTWALRRAAGFSLVGAIPRPWSAPAARLSSGCVSAHLRAGRHMLCCPTCTPTRGPSGRRAVTLGSAAGAPAVERIATTLLTSLKCALTFHGEQAAVGIHLAPDPLFPVSRQLSELSSGSHRRRRRVADTAFRATLRERLTR